MFCSKCGKQLNDGAAFCDGCGAPVSSGVQETKSYSNLANGFETLSPELLDKKYKKIVFAVINSASSLFEFFLCIPLFFKGMPLQAFFRQSYESYASQFLERIWDRYTLICFAAGAFILTAVIIKSIKMYKVYLYGGYAKYEKIYASVIRCIYLLFTVIPYIVFFEAMNGYAFFMVLMTTVFLVLEFVVNVKAKNKEIIEEYRLKKAPKDYLHEETVRINRGPVKKVELNSDGRWECEECGTLNPSTQSFCKDCGKYR